MAGLLFMGIRIRGIPWLWHSTDGGITWTGIVIAGMTGPTSVRQTPNALSVTEPLGIGIWTSIDGGLNWTTHSSKKNGLDFVDNFHGVATEYDKVGDNGSDFLSTSDGGLNWYTVPGGIQHEGFGVYGIKRSHIFVVAPEDTSIGTVALLTIARSSFDRLWSVLESRDITSNADHGRMLAGVNGVIYVQSSGANVAS